MPMRRWSVVAVAMLGFAAVGSAAGVDQGAVALVNANLIDGRGNAPVPGQTILIADGRISAIFESDGRPLPPATRVIALDGQTVLPGLIEGHVHLTPNPDAAGGLRRMLRSGITTVRDVGGDARVMKKLKSEAAATPGPMPELVYSAVVYGPQFLADPRAVSSARGLAPGSAPWSRVVTADSDVASVVSDAKETGATGIKLYASIEAGLLQRLVDEAKRQGLKTWSHSPLFPASVDDVVAAQPDQVIHAKGFITAGATDLPDNFAEGTGKWIAAQDFNAVDPGGPRFTPLFASMVDAGTILEPALLADIDLPGRRDGINMPQPTGARPPWLAHMADWACRLTGVAHRAGVAISAGTDTFGNQPYLGREIERLVDCGLSPVDAIRAATWNNARAMGLEDEIGSIEEGKQADLVVLAADPSSDISRINDVRMVVNNGAVVDIAD